MGEPSQRALEELIVALLAERRPGSTICPSDVARAWSRTHDEAGEAWRRLMEPTRIAARALVERGVVEITQRGTAVDDVEAVRGPIRLRLAREGQRVRSR